MALTNISRHQVGEKISNEDGTGVRGEVDIIKLGMLGVKRGHKAEESPHVAGLALKRGSLDRSNVSVAPGEVEGSSRPVRKKVYSMLKMGRNTSL